MKQLQTTGIILRRTDYGEADRIITLLTPDYGKLSLLAKGVRKVKSKLAGGIELFSVSHITFIQGRGDVGTLVSTRLEKHYHHIVDDLDRTMLGYDLIKQLNKATEDQPEAEYFHLLEQAFVALDDPHISLDLIRIWFSAQLLRLDGHTPNLEQDTKGIKLQPDEKYEYSLENSCFEVRPNGNFDSNSIKFLRLLFSGNQPATLAKVSGAGELVDHTKRLVLHLYQQYIH